MKKIKVAFAAFTAVAGIGGAYATTHQESANRAGTLFNWYTVVNNHQTFVNLTIGQAKVRSGCPDTGAKPCLRGTGVTVGGTAVQYTIKKP